MRPVNVIVGAAAVGLATYLAWESAPRRAVAYVLEDGGTIPDGGMIVSTDAGMSNLAPSASSAAASADAAVADLALPGMDDAGGLIPVLSTNAPKGERLGIVLIAYAGAETLPNQPTPKRSKAEAKELADKLAVDAQTDFHGAVQRGDSGSGDDLGRFYRGDLDPATEYVVFSLPVGGVSTVVDTPRGFWIAKRVE